MTTLTVLDIENFWIRLYFHGEKDFIKASIKRAYRDFNRTLHGITKSKSIDRYVILHNIMLEIIDSLIANEFEKQDAFDQWHKNSCEKLKFAFLSCAGYSLHVGQSQKWINMTLKYLFALGDRVSGIALKYQYFHIPIDRIILDKLDTKFSKSWSRIDDYNEYLNFQKKVRQQFPNELPIDIEFRLYND